MRKNKKFTDHSWEIVEILSHTFLTKISWKQRFSSLKKWVNFTKILGESKFRVFANFADIQLFSSKLFSKKLVSRNFCEKNIDNKIRHRNLQTPLEIHFVWGLDVSSNSIALQLTRNFNVHTFLPSLLIRDKYMNFYTFPHGLLVKW